MQQMNHFHIILHEMTIWSHAVVSVASVAALLQLLHPYRRSANNISTLIVHDAQTVKPDFQTKTHPRDIKLYKLNNLQTS